MGNLTQFIKSIGGLVLVGTIIVLGTGLTVYSGYSVTKNLPDQGYDPNVIQSTDNLYEGAKRGGTKRKKNKSSKNKKR